MIRKEHLGPFIILPFIILQTSLAATEPRQDVN